MASRIAQIATVSGDGGRPTNACDGDRETHGRCQSCDHACKTYGVPLLAKDLLVHEQITYNAQDARHQYDLGDMLTGGGNPAMNYSFGGRAGTTRKIQFCSNKPGLIACRYFTKYGFRLSLARLHELLRPDLQAQTISPDTLVVHLRIGDVIEMNTTFTRLSFWDPSFYAHVCVPDAVKRVEIVAGQHDNQTSIKSAQYIADVAMLFARRGYPVAILAKFTADAAFVYMASAAWFLPAKGGKYTTLIASLVPLSGGRIVGQENCSHPVDTEIRGVWDFWA